MSPTPPLAPDKSRLAVLLEHFGTIEDPRDVRRILHPLSEVLLLVVCATIADCDGLRSHRRLGLKAISPEHDRYGRISRIGCKSHTRTGNGQGQSPGTLLTSLRQRYGYSSLSKTSSSAVICMPLVSGPR
jgi:hypothetical protein